MSSIDMRMLCNIITQNSVTLSTKYLFSHSWVYRLAGEHLPVSFWGSGWTESSATWGRFLCQKSKLLEGQAGTGVDIEAWSWSRRDTAISARIQSTSKRYIPSTEVRGGREYLPKIIQPTTANICHFLGDQSYSGEETNRALPLVTLHSHFGGLRWGARQWTHQQNNTS